MINYQSIAFNTPVIFDNPPNLKEVSGPKFFIAALYSFDLF
jgi:hypothetical protein